MKALIENSHDLSKQPFDFSLITDHPKPVPGPGDLLLRAMAAATNPVDVVRKYMGIASEKFPVVVGYDVSGVVQAVGDGVTEFVVGDRVFGNVMAKSAGPKGPYGTMAEYVLAPAELMAKIPEGVSFEEAAAVPVVAITSVQLFQETEVQRGDKVFISGGAGGIGIHALQLAKGHFQAAETATTASTGVKTDFCKEKGAADHVIDYKSQDAGQVLQGWADVVYDTTKEVQMGAQILKPSQPKSKIRTIADFEHPEIAAPLQCVPTKERINIIAGNLASGKLKAVIDKVFPLDEAIQAFEYQASGRAMGKVIVKMY